MDPLTRQQLERRVEKEIRLLLTEGDIPYLRSLGHTEFVEALANELRFLGRYTHSDKETPIIIRALLENYIAHWKQASPFVPIYDSAAAWIVTISESGIGAHCEKN